MRLDASVIGPGQLVLMDLARPERFSAEAGSSIVLFVPRGLLDEAMLDPVPLHGPMPSGIAGSIVGDRLRSIVSNADAMTMREAQQLARSTMHLVGGLVSSAPEARQRARPVYEATLLRQLSRYVELHLSEPTLSAEQIAKSFKLSRATL